MEDSENLAVVILASVMLGFPLVLLTAMLWMSKNRGFTALAKVYPIAQTQLKCDWKWTSASVGPLRYRGGIAFAADRHGLFIRVIRPFAGVGPNQLFIPWSEIEATRKKSLFGELIQLHGRRMPETIIRMWRRDFERLITQAPEPGRFLA